MEGINVLEMLQIIIERFFGKWYSMLCLLTFSVITYIQLVSTWEESENAKLYSITILIAICIFNICYDVYVVNNYYIKRAPRKKVGVLVNLDTENMRIYKDTKRKFGREFEKNVYGKFTVIYIPFERSINLKDKTKLCRLLQRKRCILFVNITINTDSIDNTSLYDMQVNATILHRHYEEHIKEIFAKEFSGQIKQFSKLEFPTNEIISKLRVTAVRMSLICNYVIGLSFFLNGDIIWAEKVLEDLIKALRLYEERNEKLITRTENVIYDILMTKSIIYLKYIQSNPDKREFIEKMEACLDEANLYVKETPDYCLNKAYCCVLLDKIDEAKKYINLCKQKSGKNMKWKYSEAFLIAYENRSIISIISKYKDALKVDYNRVYLIEYIEIILQSKPEREGLYLALGILYEDIGDKVLAKESYERYLESKEDRNRVFGIIRRKGLYAS